MCLTTGNVWAVNGNRLFSGSSPGLVDGLEVLAAILHPNRYQIQVLSHIAYTCSCTCTDTDTDFISFYIHTWTLTKPIIFQQTL